jgi:hypothetical protein
MKRRRQRHRRYSQYQDGKTLPGYQLKLEKVAIVWSTWRSARRATVSQRASSIATLDGRRIKWTVLLDVVGRWHSSFKRDAGKIGIWTVSAPHLWLTETMEALRLAWVGL